MSDRVRILIELPEREYRRLLHYAVLRGKTVNQAAPELIAYGLRAVDRRDCDFMDGGK